MSTFLARVGRFSARHRLIVIGAWLLIFASLIGTLVIGSQNGAADKASPSIPDSAASQALDRMNTEFPATEGATGDTLQLVFQPISGDVTDPATITAIESLLNEAESLPGVESVSNPFDPMRPYISEDNSIAVATISYGNLNEEQEASDYAAALELQTSAPNRLGVELGGNLVPLGAPAPGIGEGVGVVIAFLVLILTFGSLVAAGVNLLIAVFGVGVELGRRCRLWLLGPDRGQCDHPGLDVGTGRGNRLHPLHPLPLSNGTQVGQERRGFRRTGHRDRRNRSRLRRPDRDRRARRPPRRQPQLHHRNGIRGRRRGSRRSAAVADASSRSPTHDGHPRPLEEAAPGAARRAPVGRRHRAEARRSSGMGPASSSNGRSSPCSAASSCS